MARTLIPTTELEPIKATLTVDPTGTENALLFTSIEGGPGGNEVSVEYVEAGVSTSLSVVVNGRAIVVNLETDSGSNGISTASEVLAALLSSADALRLVSVELAGGDDGTGTIAEDIAATNLTGGALGQAQPALTNGDATNDHYVTENDGLLVVECVSTDGGAQSVSIHYTPTLSPGVVIPVRVEPVPSMATVILGPWAPRLFNQNNAGDVYLDPSVSGTLDFRAYKIIRQS